MLPEILHKVQAMAFAQQEPGTYYPRPSMAGPDRCIRQMVYQARAFEADRGIPGRIVNVLDDSSWHEELTADLLGQTAYVLHSQQMEVAVLDVAPKLKGKIDGILTDPIGLDRLWEHKALNHFTFQKYAGLKEFPEDYFCQCAIYLRGLKADNPELCEALLLIKNKNTSDFMEYHLYYDDEADCLSLFEVAFPTHKVKFVNEVRPLIVQQACEKFRAINNHVQDQTLPPRPFEYGDWHCEYCRFSKQCWSEYAEELKAIQGEGLLETDMADTLRYYNELGAQIAEQDNERREIRLEIVKTLKERGFKKGKAGEYEASMSVTEREKINWDDVPPTAQHEIDQCKTKMPVVTLRVNKLPEPKAKEETSESIQT